MSMQKTLGGDRLGSGKKNKVSLHGYERSTHDMGYLWRSTMSSGTLVPFLSEVALPGDTFDINLDCDIKTHPTIGPLFGSYKIQLDVFQAPIRLYIGKLHNNKLGIGMNMANVKLPRFTLTATKLTPPIADLDNAQINPSCLLSYLGLRGIGVLNAADTEKPRDFNALPLLAYWDIYKNYYANKQEEIGAVIHTAVPTVDETVTTINVQNVILPDGDIPQDPLTASLTLTTSTSIILTSTPTTPLPDTVIIQTNTGSYPLDSLFYTKVDNGTTTATYTGYKWAQFGNMVAINWRYSNAGASPVYAPRVETFELIDIDTMRENILAETSNSAFNLNEQELEPYKFLLEDPDNGINSIQFTQEGLAIKTYQSDLFNNWLSTEWIDGTGGINEITAIDTSGGSFNIDTLNLSKKVYDMLNRIAVSGGTYDDWLDAVYTHERYQRCETPMYMGGLIKELIFQEVVSNSESDTSNGNQPLGTLAGKGVMSKKHKGGQITIKVDEPSYIIGIISLTPRIDYSQGNKWDTHLATMDDLHKPALDEIGFQELITEQMAWWSTSQETDAGEWITKSAGKQPAWINYMTNVNQTRGNFAIPTNEMFMTLNRRYESTSATGEIDDLTTYIDPAKYNNIFAQTAIDAQNFWAQIAVDITARRKMSAKVMPNL